MQVLDHLLGLEPLFRTEVGQELWARQAAANLRAERERCGTSPAPDRQPFSAARKVAASLS
ncbi:Uncharacterised protein [Mycobacteroides abscessus subsp. abscessus]|nr:Uncharacterised protein [Mycobacteroides abscessus subsp. abscessus]